MRFLRVLLLFTLPLYFFSCKPQQKFTNYLQDVPDSLAKTNIEIPDLRIQKGDIVTIQILSLSLKPEISDAMFNQPVVGTSLPGYLVDNNGDILHHRLGLIHADGLTKKELSEEIKKRLTVPVELLSEPTVVVHITNFKITVLGQVGTQGVIPVPAEKLTILEAIGLAGGVSDYGKKTNLKILREQNGKRETGRIDLSSKDIFDSPFYYLAQNDVLIIEATNNKIKDDEQVRVAQKISFAFTLVTVAATIANLFIR